MKENYELIEHIYEDAQMACYTLTKLTEDLKKKDNKIKNALEDILKEYTNFKTKAKDLLKDKNEEINEKSPISKIMANMGIKKEVLIDNSDSAIAQMLIEGISMGSLDIEKKIHVYEKEDIKDQIKFAKEFLKFQEDSIDKLKKYL